jgi:hypothetical protein
VILFVAGMNAIGLPLERVPSKRDRLCQNDIYYPPFALNCQGFFLFLRLIGYFDFFANLFRGKEDNALPDSSTLPEPPEESLRPKGIPFFLFLVYVIRGPGDIGRPFSEGRDTTWEDDSEGRPRFFVTRVPGGSSCLDG